MLHDIKKSGSQIKSNPSLSEAVFRGIMLCLGAILISIIMPYAASAQSVPDSSSPYVKITVDGIDNRRIIDCLNSVQETTQGTSAYCEIVNGIYRQCTEMPGDKEANCNQLFKGALGDLQSADKNENYGIEEKNNNAAPPSTYTGSKFATRTIPKVQIDGKQLSNAYNGALAIAGALAVVFVIIGGIKYATSSGDPQAATKARNTILYALIGLVVVMSAFVIVRLVTGSV